MMKPILIPARHCENKRNVCHFFGHTMKYEEDFCNLYNQNTGTDEQYPAKKKPDFCKAESVKIKSVEVRNVKT